MRVDVFVCVFSMPCKISSVHVKAGDKVVKDQTLMVLEVIKLFKLLFLLVMKMHVT